MSGRRGLGAILVVVGLVLAGVGAAGAFGVFRSPTAAAPTPSPLLTPAPAPSAAETEPIAVATPTTAPTVAPTPVPTPEPTTDVEALVRAFFVELAAALREGRARDMVDALAPAVFERYGREACEARFENQPAEPSRAFEITAVRPPAPWDWTLDGRTTTIPDAITVEARVTGPTPSGDATADAEIHVQLVDGEVRWFTDCGEPLG